jgi:hypothetical protein
MKPFILLLLLLFIFLQQNKIIAQNIEQLKNEKLATVSGSIGATTTVYAASGITARRVPFSWLLSANVNVKLKGVELPFSFILTEQNRDFRQPFNQFGLSPKYKNIQLHLGWRNLQYSNYTLNGHTFLGAGIDFKPGKFSIGAMYGRFLKAVPEDSAKTIANSGSQVPYAGYNRTGYAVKLGYGTSSNNISLIYLKGKDDVASLVVKPVKNVVAPAENAVLGIKAKLTVAKKLSWTLDGAISGYTRDTRAAAYPTDGEPLLKKLNTIFPAKLSSSFYYAGESSIGYNEKQYGIKLKYQRILPDYKSMGMYFVQTDVDRKTIEARWNDVKNTVSINASFGIEKDNLTNKKLATTARNVGSVNFNYNPSPKYGITVSYMNYGTTQSPGLKSISDTVRLDQVTNSIIIVPRYTLIRKKAVHNIILNLSNQSLNDNNKFNSSNFQMNVSNATVTYVLNLLKSNYSFDVSPFYVQSKIAAGTAVNMGGNLGVNKSFLKNKLSGGVSASYSTNQFNSVGNGYTTQGRFTTGYRVDKHHKLQLQVSHIINESNAAVVSKSFNETTGQINYTYSF